MLKYIFFPRIKNEESSSFSTLQKSTFKIRSQILNETRKIEIYEPIDLKAHSLKTVVFLLDGEKSKKSIPIIHSLRNDFVILSIINTKRRRDCFKISGIVNFSGFLEHELFPFLFKKLGNNLIKLIHGHSISGHFVLLSIILNSDLFDGFIATSPLITDNFINSIKYFGR